MPFRGRARAASRVDSPASGGIESFHYPRLPLSRRFRRVILRRLGENQSKRAEKPEGERESVSSAAKPPGGVHHIHPMVKKRCR